MPCSSARPFLTLLSGAHQMQCLRDRIRHHNGQLSGPIISRQLRASRQSVFTRSPAPPGTGVDATTSPPAPSQSVASTARRSLSGPTHNKNAAPPDTVSSPVSRLDSSRFAITQRPISPPAPLQLPKIVSAWTVLRFYSLCRPAHFRLWLVLQIFRSQHNPRLPDGGHPCEL